MPTYILTKEQRDIIVSALKVHYIEANNEGFDPDRLNNLIEYIENPYSGSWMGKSNTK
jgi:hypothetical protein